MVAQQVGTASSPPGAPTSAHKARHSSARELVFLAALAEIQLKAV